MKTISEYRVNALEENTEVIEFDDLHVVVLGTGDGDGTFAGLMEEVTVKRNIKYDFVDVKKAWIADSDIEIGNVKIRNINGKNKDCKIEMQILLYLLEQEPLKLYLHNQWFLLYKI